MFKLLDRAADRIIDAIIRGIDDTRTRKPTVPKELSEHEKQAQVDTVKKMWTKNGHFIG